MTPRILITGGSGRLGTELRAQLPELIAPTSRELNITDAEQVHAVLKGERPNVVVHAAAYTNVSQAESEHARCWAVNVEGTRHIDRACNEIGAKFVHISTDYVFDGIKGHYRETDVPGPVVNYYSLTKIIAEEAARSSRRYLVIRTSFRPREFQYPVAFSDVYTGQDYIDIIAPLLAEVIIHAEDLSDQILHVVTERKSVYDLARRRNPSIQEGRRSDAAVTLPADVSLNTDRWQALRASWLPQG